MVVDSREIRSKSEGPPSRERVHVPVEREQPVAGHVEAEVVGKAPGGFVSGAGEAVREKRSPSEDTGGNPKDEGSLRSPDGRCVQFVQRSGAAPRGEAAPTSEEVIQRRDLHWGNILVKRTNNRTIEYTLIGSTFQIPTYNLEASIIDYTLSRLEKDGHTVFCELSANEELFQGEGDYQFDIYRMMKEENGNIWSENHPHSNVLWLHYVADKFIKEMRYKKKANTPSMKRTQRKLLNFHKEVLKFHSAREVLQKSSLFH